MTDYKTDYQYALVCTVYPTCILTVSLVVIHSSYCICFKYCNWLQKWMSALVSFLSVLLWIILLFWWMPRIVLIFQLVYLNWNSTDWTKLVWNGCPYVEFVTHQVGLQTGWNLMPIKSAGMGGKTSTLVTMRAVWKSLKFVCVSDPHLLPWYYYYITPCGCLCVCVYYI